MQEKESKWTDKSYCSSCKWK